ncbi:MAG: hypothetical protein IPP71_03835 [Bacteroidetes bacterium]|nr:hypothetical protein [Bacteroidota bacterium]
MPIVLVPYLVYRKEFKGAISTLLFSLLFLVLPAIVLGWQWNLNLLTAWWHVINPANAEHLMELELGPHSLTALLPTLLCDTKGTLPYVRNLFELDTTAATVILNVVRGSLVLFTLYFLKWPPFVTSNSRLNELRELSYLFLLIPLIFPHQQKYSFFLILPAIFYSSYFIILNFNTKMATVSKWKFYVILILCFLSFTLMTLSTDGLIGKNWNQISQYYKTITYGALLLIPLLILCKPEPIIVANSKR